MGRSRAAPPPRPSLFSALRGGPTPEEIRAHRELARELQEMSLQLWPHDKDDARESHVASVTGWPKPTVKAFLQGGKRKDTPTLLRIVIAMRMYWTLCQAGLFRPEGG